MAKGRFLKERCVYFIVRILPTICFLVTVYKYIGQRKHYEQRIMWKDNIYDSVVDLSDVDMATLEKRLTFVVSGGLYKPDNCTCNNKKKVAIIIPFRDRYYHLAIFLRHMHPFLRKQEIYYRIFVIEQTNQKLFNRGKLMNVGFSEAEKIDDFNCIVFHDVDLLPLSDGNEYSCPTSPRHMSISIDLMDFRRPYEDIFGGVSAIIPAHFKAVNGYPNRYWGWGGEDDDLSERLRAVGHKLSTPTVVNGMYKMLRHSHSTSEEYHDRKKTLKKWHEHKNTDGLNTLKYEVVRRRDYKLYTFISCNI